MAGSASMTSSCSKCCCQVVNTPPCLPSWFTLSSGVLLLTSLEWYRMRLLLCQQQDEGDSSHPEKHKAIVGFVPEYREGRKGG